MLRSACIHFDAVHWCFQALVLSYEDAPMEEQTPYLSTRLAPVPVVQFIGRSAKRDPPCPPSESVFHWYRDRIVDCPPLVAHSIACRAVRLHKATRFQVNTQTKKLMADMCACFQYKNAHDMSMMAHDAECKLCMWQEHVRNIRCP